MHAKYENYYFSSPLSNYWNGICMRLTGLKSLRDPTC